MLTQLGCVCRRMEALAWANRNTKTLERQLAPHADRLRHDAGEMEQQMKVAGTERLVSAKMDCD